MNNLTLLAALFVFSFYGFQDVSLARGSGASHFGRISTSRSSVQVKSYQKKNGTYVQAHNRSKPNKTKNDNWSHSGNVNPYTSKIGTKKR